MSPYLVLLPILEFFVARLAMLPLIQCYQITSRPVNQAICICIIMPIVFCNLVSIKCIIVLTELQSVASFHSVSLHHSL